MTIKLRPYQAEGLTALWNYFEGGGRGHPLIAWPTGTGKGIIPAVFIEYVLKTFPNQRFLMITHVKELIKQNLKNLKLIWPDSPVGVFSAGLKQKDTAFPIVFGGIQSMIKCPQIFGHRDIIFIDEAHLISVDESSMYLTFIAAMKLINPNVRVIGLTATPFRMGQGMLTDGKLFTDIVHDLTGMKGFNKLLEDGYLSPLIPKRTKTQFDISNVGILKGEFIASQLQKAVDKNEITFAGLRELVEASENRRSWLLFASGIEHSDHIAGMLGQFGIECASVHSKQSDAYNDAVIEAFKNFDLQAIVNYGKLTTGFDHPGIDLIGDFRPTMSVPLHIQKYGRGTRPTEFKSNCLVLDFAKNTERLGCINDPIIPRKKGEKAGDMPVKICEECGVYNHISARFCAGCGAEFNFKIKITSKAGHQELIKSETPIIETFDVEYVVYARKQKIDKETKIELSPPYVQATYFTGLRSFKENVFPEHQGYAKKLFENWWKQRHSIDPPQTTNEVLQHQSNLRIPKKIKVHVNTKWPAVVGTEW